MLEMASDNVEVGSEKLRVESSVHLWSAPRRGQIMGCDVCLPPTGMRYQDSQVARGGGRCSQISSLWNIPGQINNISFSLKNFIKLMWIGENRSSFTAFFLTHILALGFSGVDNFWYF